MDKNLKRKFIIVTGGAGFVGSHLVLSLLKKDPNYTIKVIDNLQRGCREFVPDVSRVEFINADLKHAAAVEEHFKNADVVFHLASVVGGVENIFKNEGSVFYETCLINLNVFKLCKKYETSIKRVLYLSTACCYPRSKQKFKYKEDGSLIVNYLKEEDAYPADPESGYGMAKLHGEQLCEKLLHESVYHIVRLHNLYGPKMACDHSSQVVPSLIRKTLKITENSDKILSVWGCGEQYRDFLFIDDAIKGILEVYEQNPTSVRTIQLGSGKATTINDLAKEICQIHGAKNGIRDIQIVSDLAYILLLNKCKQIYNNRILNVTQIFLFIVQRSFEARGR